MEYISDGNSFGDWVIFTAMFVHKWFRDNMRFSKGKGTTGRISFINGYFVIEKNG